MYMYGSLPVFVSFWLSLFVFIIFLLVNIIGRITPPPPHPTPENSRSVNEIFSTKIQTPFPVHIVRMHPTGSLSSIVYFTDIHTWNSVWSCVAILNICPLWAWFGNKFYSILFYSMPIIIDISWCVIGRTVYSMSWKVHKLV